MDESVFKLDQQESKVRLHSPEEVAQLGGSGVYYHQTIELASIQARGWDIHYKSRRRFRHYGDGVYFSTVPFWPNHTGHCIKAALILMPERHRVFSSAGDFEDHAEHLGLNRYSLEDQARIAKAFLDERMQSYSFPEDQNEDRVFDANGDISRTVVVVDPSIILVTNIN